MCESLPCDISSQMIAAGDAAEFRKTDLQKLVQPLVLRAEDIGYFPDGGIVRRSLLKLWRVELPRRSQAVGSRPRQAAQTWRHGASVLDGPLLLVGNALVSCVKANETRHFGVCIRMASPPRSQMGHSFGSITPLSVRWRALSLPNFG